MLQEHQVIVGLAHPWVLLVVLPAEKQLGAFLQNPTCAGKKGQDTLDRTGCCPLETQL